MRKDRMERIMAKKIIKALVINTILPGTSKMGSKIKSKKSFMDIYNAIDDGMLWVSNNVSVIGYPIIEYNPGENCWVYITDNGVCIRPVEKEKYTTTRQEGFTLRKEEYESLMRKGQQIIDEMFGDLLEMIENL